MCAAKIMTNTTQSEHRIEEMINLPKTKSFIGAQKHFANVWRDLSVLGLNK